MSYQYGAKIDRVRILDMALKYVKPFQISGGLSYYRHSLIVELYSDGVIGYGESAPFDAPYYSSETVSSARACLLEWLVPKIEGQTFASIEELNEVLSQGVRGNNFAKAGIETAYWDLIARKNNVPLRNIVKEKLIEYGVTGENLACNDYITMGISTGIPEDNTLKTFGKWVEQYRDAGYKRIKIKVRPGWDIEPMRVSREILGNDFPFWPDANSAYDLEKHLETLKQFDQFNCQFIEQPLHHDDIWDHAKLSKILKTPVCLDESLKSSRIAQQVVEIGSSRIWNIKLQRMGGLLEGVKTYAIAAKNNIPVWAGSMPETGIGTMAIMSLATFANFRYTADIVVSSDWYVRGSDPMEITMDSEGRSYLGKGIGIGEIDWDIYKNAKPVYDSAKS